MGEESDVSYVVDWETAVDLEFAVDFPAVLLNVEVVVWVHSFYFRFLAGFWEVYGFQTKKRVGGRRDAHLINCAQNRSFVFDLQPVLMGVFIVGEGLPELKPVVLLRAEILQTYIY